MIDLVPRYHWEYRLTDVLRGAAAALGRPAPASVHLDGVGECHAVGTGRAGLVLALQSLSVPPGSRVAVPLYCCPVVFEAVVAAGHHPAFVDVDESTYCMSPSDFAGKAARIGAAIGVHMFGNLCDFDALRNVARGRPIVEDCAQAIGTSIGERSAGTLGDVSVFSFRCGKYVSAGEGGAVFSAHSPYRERLARAVAELESVSAISELVHVASTFVKAKLYNRPAYGLIGFTIGRLLDRRLNLSAKSGVRVLGIRKSDLSVARRRLREVAGQVQRQRANAEYYAEHLDVHPRMLCAPHDAGTWSRYQYPIRCRSETERDRMADLLLADGIDCARYLDDVVPVARASFEYVGDCPVAERLSKTTLIIPSSYDLRPRTIRRIAEAVNAAWGRIAGEGGPVTRSGLHETPSAASRHP